MADDFSEKGFFRAENKLADALCKLNASGKQRQILSTIIRLTIGWKKHFAEISLGEFARITGIDRANVARSLKILVDRNIIIKKAGGYKTEYGLQRNHEKWEYHIKDKTSVNPDTTLNQSSVNTDTTFKKQSSVSTDTVLKKQTSVNLDTTLNQTSVNTDTETSVNLDTETSVNSDTTLIYKDKKDNKDSRSSAELRLAELLFSLILLRDPNFTKPDFGKWSIHIGRLMRVNNRTPEDIEKVVRYSQESEHWQQYILSTSGLRRNFQSLWAKANASEKKKEGLKEFHEFD